MHKNPTQATWLVYNLQRKSIHKLSIAIIKFFSYVIFSESWNGAEVDWKSRPEKMNGYKHLYGHIIRLRIELRKLKHFKENYKPLFRDHQQITFVTLNGFCPLIKNTPPYPHRLFLTDNVKPDGIPTETK